MGLLVQQFLRLVDHIVHSGAHKMSRTKESQGDWSRLYLSRINYVHASKTTAKGREVKAGEE